MPANPDSIFTIITYHAMFGPDSNVGVENIVRLAPVTTVTYGGAVHPVGACAVAGDFNVEYLSDPAPYANVTNAAAGWMGQSISPAASNYAKSTMIDDTFAEPTSDEYRNGTSI